MSFTSPGVRSLSQLRRRMDRTFPMQVTRELRVNRPCETGTFVCPVTLRKFTRKHWRNRTAGPRNLASTGTVPMLPVLAMFTQKVTLTLRVTRRIESPLVHFFFSVSTHTRKSSLSYSRYRRFVPYCTPMYQNPLFIRETLLRRLWGQGAAADIDLGQVLYLYDLDRNYGDRIIEVNPYLFRINSVRSKANLEGSNSLFIHYKSCMNSYSFRKSYNVLPRSSMLRGMTFE